MSEALARVAALSRILIEREARVSTLEAELSQAKRDVLKTKREDLPELLREFGLSEIKLTDGSKVTIKEDVEARITEENKERALAWLVEHEASGLIKTNVDVKFNRGDRAAAIALAQQLSRTFDSVEVAESVHPQTLKAFVREQMAAGRAVPFDLFSISPFSFASVTLPKSEK